MKITQLRDKDKTTALTTMDMETWIGKTRTETKTRPVSAFREVLRYSLPDSRCYEADKLPKILPAAEFRRTEGGKQMKSYNGIVELTVGPLSGGPEITLVKQLAWEQPQTHCVFTGSSGRTVKIWAKFTRPDNSLPQKREEAEIFHAHAYRLAVKCYQPQIPFSILPKEPSLEQYSRLSYDPELMYRPDSVPFYLSQPSGMPEELTYREAVRSEKSPLTRAVPGYDTERAVFMLFEAALRKTHEEIYEAEDEGAPERGEDFQAMVTQLAVNCFHSGIPEEETVKRTIFHYYLRRQEVLIRQLVKNVYEEQKGFGKKSSLGKEQYLSLQTEEFMNRRYEFRYNTQVGEVEYRERNSFHFYFNPINKRVLNSIALKAKNSRLKDGYDKINRANAVAGPEFLLDIIEGNFKIKVDDYILVDFYSLIDIIDILGGIPMTLTDAEAEAANNYIRDMDFDRGVSDWETANVLTGGGDLILNGVQAVGYSRERQTSGSDFNRTSRQRAVIEQIIVKAKKMSVTQLNDLANSILPKVYTNMSESEILGMVADAVTYLGYDLEQYRVPFDNMYESVNGNLLPDYEATNQKLQDIIFATE